MEIRATSCAPLTSDEQAQLWQKLFQHTPGGIFGLEAVRDEPGGAIVDFRYRFINDVALSHVFRPQPDRQHDVTGQLFSAYFPSIHQSPLWQLYLTVADTQETVQGEGEYLFDGHDLRVKMAITPFGSDRILISYNEISDNYHARLALERQARLLDGLMSTVQNGISVLEAVRDEAGRLIDFRFLDVSNALLAGLGRSRREVVDNNILTVLPGLRETTVWPNYLRVLETGIPHRFEQHYNQDGFDRYFDLSVARLNDGLVVSFTNISNTKQTQMQLESMVIELRLSNESLNQFAYVASHDLQEPLRKIVSFGDLLQQEFSQELSDPANDMIRRMQQAAGRMRILVQDLLTYSRLTSQPLQFQSVSLDQLMAGIMADFDETIREQRADITVMPLPEVWGNSQLLSQLFQNLISNSLKFAKPGEPPRIVITGRIIPPENTPPGVGPCADIQIADEGIGFDEKYLDRIFTVFQRLHGQRQYPGTGIGLAICKKVIDMHGGTISARSSPLAGAVFTVQLPVS